ncbi:protein diaphanous homolog 1-like [Homarus americanus]|uniref:protein diaphanous homolog 1-like n=1 Tax=Homarus americanus TaxID=6706 RepID=UPI001C47FE44|nr:protein diaphanous homolog 1-like [Homarus americanus]
MGRQRFCEDPLGRFRIWDGNGPSPPLVGSPLPLRGLQGTPPPPSGPSCPERTPGGVSVDGRSSQGAAARVRPPPPLGRPRPCKGLWGTTDPSMVHMVAVAPGRASASPGRAPGGAIVPRRATGNANVPGWAPEDAAIAVRAPRDTSASGRASVGPLAPRSDSSGITDFARAPEIAVDPQRAP